MKKLVLALTAVLLISALAGCQAEEVSKLEEIKKAGKITMATSPDFTPLEFMDVSKTGQDAYVGSDIALGKYIAEQLGVELVIEAMDFTACQAAVSQGKVDMAISGFAYTEERAESMLLSDFYNNTDAGQGLLVQTAQAGQYTKAEDFNGKLVAAQNASLQHNLVTSQLPDAVIEPIVSLNDAILMLIGGKVDAIAVAENNGLSFANNYPDVAMSDFMFEYSSEGNVLAIQKGQDDLMAAVNEIIAEVNEQGLYEGWRAEAEALAETLGVDAE